MIHYLFKIISKTNHFLTTIFFFKIETNRNVNLEFLVEFDINLKKQLTTWYNDGENH